MSTDRFSETTASQSSCASGSLRALRLVEHAHPNIDAVPTDTLALALAAARYRQQTSADSTNEAEREAHAAAVAWIRRAVEQRGEDVCGRCGTVESWHSAIDNACPDDDGAHPDSDYAARAVEDDAAPELIGTERGLASDEHDGQPRSTCAIPETFMETHYLALDGCRVGLSRIDSAGGADQERQLCVHVSTDDGRTDDHTPEGLPYICITLGDATLYDHEPGGDRPTSTIDPTQVRYQLHGRPERLMIDAADAISRLQSIRDGWRAEYDAHVERNGLGDLDADEVTDALDQQIGAMDAALDVLQILAHGGQPEQGKPVQS